MVCSLRDGFVDTGVDMTTFVFVSTWSRPPRPQNRSCGVESPFPALGATQALSFLREILCGEGVTQKLSQPLQIQFISLSLQKFRHFPRKITQTLERPISGKLGREGVFLGMRTKLEEQPSRRIILTIFTLNVQELAEGGVAALLSHERVRVWASKCTMHQGYRGRGHPAAGREPTHE